jgi:DNA-directed RNA polymerase subunit RPC12/RpoP
VSNRSYVCWTCRYVRRAEALHGESSKLNCPECGHRLTELGWRARIPAKDDDEEWDRLREWYRTGGVT